jgi:predicted molibdopterin-dependent oxidoreductase YjgC
VELTVNGETIVASGGITVAAALINAGHTAFRSSVTAEARGPVCGMGICYECRVTIDGAPHQRSCMRVVAPGMRVDTGGLDAR